MANTARPTYLRDLAFLYLALAYGTDDYLSDAELGALIEKLHEHCPELSDTSLQAVVAEALAEQMETDDVTAAVRKAAQALIDHFDSPRRDTILQDLLFIAEADGVVLHKERTLLRQLADAWDVELPYLPGSSLGVDVDTSQSWSVLHDLAFLYLVLAHSTDDELSTAEVQVILNKLQEWQPQLEHEQVVAVLDAAIDRYTRGPDESTLSASVRSVRDGLPEKQRMAALNDLIQIANADGVFLDNEEDMINDFMDAWEVAAFSNYGKQGKKRP